MFWAVIFLVSLAIIGVSVAFGLSANAQKRRRRERGGELTNAEKVRLAKQAGVFPHRKSGQDGAD